ncbi:uncharacterized protein SPPG_09328 [Spizellomyces punctatus DAOM BR117]|uniref:BRISC and BRCA1-A complex member 2 n=1 Tax=Spizellomyces punctatus (strain DAOM BR117) TaxID=645134 RepID=A0A0L0HD67_SPIPD|nr:uncharacterized protein SPPG_09328 [Spizellomyces punctatus DAOM BR117]KNC98961.1 hypothetical protein SPPG_09328 [Spizellomyces punctatus DAOM BR117]|eukprot:XP_016607001.1 hypothetical protein SPPG_09328 [Spizellomyces punctatus DAOM BR117]
MLRSLHPKLRPLAEPLLNARDLYELKTARPSTYKNRSEGECTRFDVGVKCVGEVRFQCTVIFDLGDLEFPPDLVCEDFPLKYGDIRPLIEWRSGDRNALWKTFDEIGKLYQHYQRQRITELGIERIQFDLSSFDHQKDLQCFMTAPEWMSTDATIYIYMPVRVDDKDESNLLLLDINESSVLVARLTVMFHVYEGEVKQIEKQIQLPPQWKDIYVPKIPDYPLDATLFDYMLEVQKYLATVHSNVIQRIDRRREFVETIVATFRSHILEYDSREWFYASFYFEIPPPQTSPSDLSPVDRKNNSRAVANVHLSQDYPDIPPEVFLQSASMFADADSYIPATVRLNVDFGLVGMWGSERVSCEEAVERFRNALLEQIPTAFACIP